MKRGTILILSMICAIALLMLYGCGMMPGSAEEAVMGEKAPSEETTPEHAPEDIAEQLIEQVKTEAETVPEPEPNITVENVTVENITVISGDLALQDDLALCPHLKQEFQCNREDVRWCDIQRIVGDDDFLPDYMICKDGDPAKGEKSDHRYCLILDCSPVSVENIVTQYGTHVAFAEYIYSTTKAGTGIMNTYTLTRCGEEEKGFDSERECRYYGSRIGLP